MPWAMLEATAQALVAPKKGILAADESHATIGRRFEEHGISNSEENRRRYRQMLLVTKGIGEFISGVILFDETIRRGPAGRYTAELEQAPDAPVPGGSMILAEHPHRVERTCLTLAGPASEGRGVATPPAPARRASRGVARGGHLWTASACRPRPVPLEGEGPEVRGRCRDRSHRAGCGVQAGVGVVLVAVWVGERPGPVPPAR